MKRSIRIKSLLLIFISFVLLSGSIFAQGYENDMLKGVVRVKFKPQLSATLASVNAIRANGIKQTGIQPFDNVSSQLSAVEIKRVFPYSEKHEAKHRKHGLDLWYQIRYDSGISPLNAILAYREVEEIDVAEPVYKKSLIRSDPNNSIEPLSNEELPFNDEHLPLQWHYKNNGEMEQTVAGADINLFKAWELEVGKPNVIVNIVDGGFQTDHPDLSANIWVNEYEANGEEGVDDDGNGYIDDIQGYNFVDDNGEITSHPHGTHTAGTVAAVSNNGIGVSGVAGGSGNGDGVRIMSSQIFTNSGGVANYAAAIVYGADNGAVISQNSWGYDSPGFMEQALYDAIDYFIEEAGLYPNSPMKGGVVIFAAGNSNANAEYYPGYYDKTIAVGAIEADFTRAVYSNYGDWVDVCAPGGNMTNGDEYGVLSTGINSKYVYMDGTSMACPHVSGIAGLIVSKFGSSTYTNKKLKQRLITSTRNIDQYNPDYVGMLGSGYMDAFLALSEDNGKSPDVVSDLTVLGSAQNFINIQWTLPTDEDDEVPSEYEVLYFKEPITSDNVKQVYKIRNNVKKVAGTVMSLEIKELDSQTEYFIAVRHIDRWGNVSKLSNEVNALTNTGPEVGADIAQFDLEIDANVSTSLQESFELHNNADGLLQWKAHTHFKNVNISWNSNSISYPVANNSVSQKNIGEAFVTNGEVRNNDISAMGTKSFVAYSEDISYTEYYSSHIRIGEVDTDFTNSSATKYVVDFPEGFNLTQVEMSMQHDPATGPLVVEVYKGAELKKENIVYAQQYDNQNGEYRNFVIPLEEQIYFENGDQFWIAIHVPAGNLYPLAISKELEPHYSDYCMMSLDMGNTWNNLSEVIEDDTYAWACNAVSKNKHLGTYVVLTPNTGELAGNSTQDIIFDIDASTLINGSYTSNIVFSSNDSNNELYSIPLNLTIINQKPELVTEKIVEFGSIFHGEQKEITIPIQNIGYGIFNSVSTVISDETQFEILQKPSSISAQGEGNIKVRFSPNSPGNANATITLTDQKGNSHNITLFASAIAPSEISITPGSANLGEFALGDKANSSFTIINDGEYPLEYVIPQFAPDKTIEGKENVHKYGYSIENNIEDTSVAFEWNDISSKGTDVSEYFKNYNNSNKYFEVDLGFEFLFYGVTTEKMNITRYGTLTLNKDGGLGTCYPQNFSSNCNPAGYISAFATWFDINKQGAIYYLREPGKFTVQYQNVISENSRGNTAEHGTFQIVLFDNGNINLVYKDVENFNSYQLETAYIAIGDPNYSDAILINGIKEYPEEISGRVSSNETIYKIIAPGDDLISYVSKPYGIVPAGESVDIDLTVDTKNAFEGKQAQSLSIISNDPFQPLENFSVNLDITSGGVAEITLSREAIEMGEVFQGAEKRDLIVIKNDGTRAVEVTSITKSSDDFIVEAELPMLLKPRSSNFIYVDLNTATKGVKTDELLITTSEGDSYNISMNGSVVAAPGISVDIVEFNETLDAGDKLSRSIVVTNDGESDLELVPFGNDWLHLNDLTTKSVSNLPDFTYYTLDSDEEGGSPFAWEDIRETGTRTPHAYFWDNNEFWIPVPLPYEIPFYEQLTDTIWVSWEGVISMNKPVINPYVYMPVAMPNVEEPNNIIAPYCAVHWDSNSNMYPDQEVGIFHEVFDDRVVVMWSEVNNLFGVGEPYSFEAIIYKNGVVKFQYKTKSTSRTSYGVIGVENADGTDAVQLAAYQKYIKNELAVSFFPGKKIIVPAGESKQLDLVVDASYLHRGDYLGKFYLKNNVPNEEKVEVNVSLTVNGNAKVEMPESLEFGELMAYEVETSYGAQPKSYTKEFSIKNVGKDDLSISRLRYEGETQALVEILMTLRTGRLRWESIERVRSIPELEPAGYHRLRMSLSPSPEQGDIVDKLVFNTNTPEGEMVMPINGKVIMPPQIGLNKEEINVLASTSSHVETQSVVIDNTNGHSPLLYNLVVNYGRGEEDNVTTPQAFESYSSYGEPLLSLIASDDFNSAVIPNTKAVKNDEDFETILEYEKAESAENSVGYGEEFAFTTGTAFTAPKRGFNLTHVKTWYRPDDNVLTDIIVEIRAGSDDINETRLLHSETFKVELEETIADGKYMTFELSENQIFYPGEKFFVVFTYALGVGLPQGVAPVSETVSGRFMYKGGEDWFDLINSDFSDSGWMVKALEKEHESKSWAIILSDEQGAINAGESAEVLVKFIAADAQDANNLAYLTVESNDPLNASKEVEMNLRVNQGPSFTLVDDPNLEVNENESLSFKVVVDDIEGDEYTYELGEDYQFVNMSVSNDTISIVYAPDFESSGMHSFILNGEDTFGNTSSFYIDVEVANVNRAPEVINTIATREYYEDGEYEEISLVSIFADPDGEKLIFSVSSDNEFFINIFVADEDVIIKSQSEGTGLVTLSATDNEGLSVETQFEVIVGTVTGIEDPEGTTATKVYPVPTTGPLNVVLGSEIEGEVSISIINVTGITQYQTTVNKMSGEHIERLNISSMPSGIYLVKISSAKGDIVKRVVKI